jgi:hypothetical protein
MGGKSRKSGGVSKRLIERLKAGQNPLDKQKPIKVQKDEKNTRKSLFEEN